jgi:thiamine biosynthesis lipoprotein
MSPDIIVSTHHSMNTWWQVRISGEDPAYCAQASQAAFSITDQMESLMSRFRDESEISAIARIPEGGRLRLSKSVFDCLTLALKLQYATSGSFDVCASNHYQQKKSPSWHLDDSTQEFVADVPPCRIDLGAIAKGFSLDLMAEELSLWDIKRFLLLSSGSSILAGECPEGKEGWAVMIGEGDDARILNLCKNAVGTSGFAMQPGHIIDPRTGRASERYLRSWALAPSAAEADALSTAWMNMDWEEIEKFCAHSGHFAAGLLLFKGNEMRFTGLSSLLNSKST